MITAFFFIAGEVLSYIHMQMTMGIFAGILVPALFFNMYQIIFPERRKHKNERQKVYKSGKKDRLKILSVWLSIWSIAALCGAICCYSADSYCKVYKELLSVQSQKEAYIDEVYVEGTVSRIEQKSKMWIYLENSSISYDDEVKTTAEGVIAVIEKGNKPLAGSIISLKGKLSLFQTAKNPGAFNQRKYYHNMGYDFCLNANEWIQTSKDYDYFAEWMWKLRDILKDRLKQLTTSKDYGVYCALLFGDKSLLDEEQKALFEEQGISHILSVSGLHISVVGMFIYRLIMKQTGSFGIAGAISGAGVIFYAAFTGNAVSAVRAAVMYLFLALSRHRGRIYDMPTAAAVAALVILIINPLAIFQSSMQFSFGAITGLSLVSDIFKRFTEKSNAQKDKYFSVMGLSITMLPIILYHNYQYPLYTILINQLVVPLTGLLMVSAASSLFASYISIGVAKLVAKVGHLVLYFYELICKLSSKLFMSVFCTGRPSLWRIAIFFMLIISTGIISRLVCKKRRKCGRCLLSSKKKLRNMLISTLIPASIYTFGCIFLHADTYDGLKITILDVGQGDGIFLEFDDGTTIMSDAGSSSQKQLGTYVLEPFLSSKGITDIDYVILSHADSDHTSGVIDIMQSNPNMIKTLILPDDKYSMEQFALITDLAEKNKIPIVKAAKGDIFCGTSGRFSIEILWPNRNSCIEDSNASSLVWRLLYGDFSMLFTGDLLAEQEMCLTNIEPSTVLKVAHHGSAYSTETNFLRLVQPQVSVISCSSTNRYGHPSDKLLKRLKNCGTRIFMTKEHHAVTIKTDGKDVWITTMGEK